MSSPVFMKIFQQAEKTFSNRNRDSYKTNFALLKKLVDKLVYSDLNLNPFLFSKKAFLVKNKAPCTFVNIYEKLDGPFSMSIFIIDENYKMPLHDHPNMTGMLKVISGKLKAECYTQIPTDKENGRLEKIVRVEQPKILSETSEAAVLYPDNCNFHELTALEGPAAFFDILSPPYSDISDTTPDARHCSFFKKEKIMVDNNGSNPTVKLTQIPVPDHYYCDSVYYDQPDFMR
ncbi:2-aminoethanethiol dioxygenase [Chironomus tepperi]|uniref:2-aminoethanethiol dioxygenase n=1 Tax=Chironomus tepperi TaxID=113505 RepID=UPI00391FC952